jgi:hypothetical protein
VARSLLVLLVLAAACSGGDDDAYDGKPLPGSAPSLQRWVVRFEGDGPDLAAYRKASVDDPSAVPAIVAGLREKQQKEREEFKTKVEAVGGKVVDWWWMSNAATIEIDASGLPTIQKADGVRSVSPDRLLE